MCLHGVSGTCARDVLSYLQEHEPDLYSTCDYTIIELSAKLHEIQKQRLSPFAGHVTLFNKSITEWDQEVKEECFVIGLEV